MGLISSLGQALQETLLNNYLKTNFKNSVLEFYKGKIFLKKSPLFESLNVNISRTAYAKKINESISKSSYQVLSYERIVGFLISN